MVQVDHVFLSLDAIQTVMFLIAIDGFPLAKITISHEVMKISSLQLLSLYVFVQLCFYFMFLLIMKEAERSK